MLVLLLVACDNPIPTVLQPSPVAEELVVEPTLQVAAQAAQEAFGENCIPSVPSFSARAVTPRLNRATWSRPRQVTSCEFTGFELAVTWPDGPPRTHAVQLNTLELEYLHGAADDCGELSSTPNNRGYHCSNTMLTDADSIVTYSIRARNFANNTGGPWSREITVRRSRSLTPAPPSFVDVVATDPGVVHVTWGNPSFPRGTALADSVTFEVARSRNGGSWRSLETGLDGNSLEVSFLELTPVGVSGSYRFRIRTNYNGRRSTWVETEGEISTIDAPAALTIRISDNNAKCVPFGTGTTCNATGGNLQRGQIYRDTMRIQILINPATSRDRNRSGSLTYSYRVSEGDRNSYGPSTDIVFSKTNIWRGQCRTGSDAKAYFTPCFQKDRDDYTIGVTYWVKVTPSIGIVEGPATEIDFTLSHGDTGSDTTPVDPRGPPPPPPTRCNPGGDDDPCWGPARPVAEANWDTPGSVTVTFSASDPGRNVNGSDARITRVEMSYEACPFQWGPRNTDRTDWGWKAVDGVACKSSSRNVDGSTGSMTFRGSFNSNVTMWEVKVEGRVRNNNGYWSGESGSDGHLTP